MERDRMRDRKEVAGEPGAGVSPEAEVKLEREIGRMLSVLPTPTAPPSLLARVMAGVVLEEARAAARPWYRTAWFDWPARMQAASLVLFGAMVAALAFGAPYLAEIGTQAIQSPIGTRAGALLSPFIALATLVQVGFVAVGALFRTIPEGVVVTIGMAALVMVAMTTVLGAALRRLSPGREIYS